MNRTIFLTACIFGLLAIILGAFGAHGLEKLVDEYAIATFETGVTYQMYHAFFLFVLGLLPQLEFGTKKLIYSLIVTGVILFSFSIYLLALNSLTNFDFGKIGFLTPIGGVFLIAGWGTLGYQLYRKVQ
ncbi:DUF423 domain-containing protein [Maribacter aestuarii]|uniref:DUF423 domain-containing protein n=1 Tax=Maribacter aestuarii TaxID=1130723 RepID=UPI00248C081F|nr:DUF423 domain-containing protein [Maribacter aestuarii]